MAELTVYPDVGTGNTTVDGQTGREGVDETWATIRGSAGTTFATGGTSHYNGYILSSTTNDQWAGVRRCLYLFDTSALTGAASISAATFSLCDDGKSDNYADSIAVVSSNPASDNDVIAADYSTLGSTLFAAALDITAINAGVYNDFALNGAGLAAISKTGITKFGTLSEADRANSMPAWASNVSSYWKARTADYTGTAKDPKLVITYTLGGSPYTLTADAGSFTQTGTAATLLQGYAFDADAGSYTQTGTAVTMRKGFTMAVDAGSFTLTGSDARPWIGYAIDADPGAFVLSGTAADLLHAQILDAAGGSFTLTGTAGTLADLLRGYAIDADAGAFALTGTAADLLYHRVFPVGSGAFTLTGTDATLLYAALFSGTAGVNTFTVGTLPVNLLSVMTLPDNDLAVTTLPANELDVTV